GRQWGRTKCRRWKARHARRPTPRGRRWKARRSWHSSRRPEAPWRLGPAKAHMESERRVKAVWDGDNTRSWFSASIGPTTASRGALARVTRCKLPGFKSRGRGKTYSGHHRRHEKYGCLGEMSTELVDYSVGGIAHEVGETPNKYAWIVFHKFN